MSIRRFKQVLDPALTILEIRMFLASNQCMQSNRFLLSRRNIILHIKSALFVSFKPKIGNIPASAYSYAPTPPPIPQSPY